MVEYIMKGAIKLTLEELNARIDAIDDCTGILFKLYFESDCTNPQIKEMFTELRERFRTLHETAWRDFNAAINAMSKQA